MLSFKRFAKRIDKSSIVEKQELYTYDNLPNIFRIQAIHILRDMVGQYVRLSRFDRAFSGNTTTNTIWEQAWHQLLKEFGVFHLGDQDADPMNQIFTYLQTCDTSQALYVIETVLDGLNSYLSRPTYDPEFRPDLSYVQGSGELNQRFEENGIGYEYINGALIRKDTQYVHNEVVKPAITLLTDVGFSGPLDEFLAAYKFYRQNNKKQAVAEASKAFESTMKAICDMKHWTYPANATAIPLINILMEHGLIPTELLGHFSSLQALLQNGLPTLSNKTSRHGQGLEPQEIEQYIVEYALNLCASNILLLIRTYKASG